MIPIFFANSLNSATFILERSEGDDEELDERDRPREDLDRLRDLPREAFVDLAFDDFAFADLAFADFAFADFDRLRDLDLAFADFAFADLAFVDLAFADLDFDRLRDLDFDFDLDLFTEGERERERPRLAGLSQSKWLQIFSIISFFDHDFLKLGTFFFEAKSINSILVIAFNSSNVGIFYLFYKV